MDYLDFDLTVEPAASGGYDVAVVGSPAGEARTQMAFPYDRLALQNKIQSLQIALLRSGGTRRAATSVEDEQSVRQLGQDLFGALFSGEVGSRLDLSRNIAKSQGKGVRIKLRFSAPELSALPWEYVYDSNRGDYLALGISTPIVRYLPIAQPIQPLEVTPPLRILAMAAGPKDLGVLDVERERLRLELALQKLIASGVVELHWVQGGAWEDLQQTLWHGPWHVFHFVGHGGFSERKGTGVLYFVGEDGNSKELSATDVARLLGDHEPLRLALLNSCETAEGASTDIFSSTAASLIRFGTPAVVAMQFQITDDAAIQFSRVFYSAVAQGMPVDSAVAEARKSVALQSQSYEWGTPVLFMRSPDGVLFDVPIQPSVATPIEHAAAVVAAAATTLPPEPQPGAASPPSVSTLPPSPPTTRAPPPPAWSPSWGAPAAVAVADPATDEAGRRRKRIALAAVAVVALLAVLFGGFLYWRSSQTGFSRFIFIDPNAGPPGTSFLVTGYGFTRDSQVTLRWADHDNLEVLTADGMGNFQTTLVVPGDAPIGQTNLSAYDSVNGDSEYENFTVTPTGVLPRASSAPPISTIAPSAPVVSEAVVDALCNFETRNGEVAAGAVNVERLVEQGASPFSAYDAMSASIADLRSDLNIIASWQPLLEWATTYSAWLNQYHAAYEAYLNHQDQATVRKAIELPAFSMNGLNQQLGAVQAAHPELGQPCWPSPE